jgi:GxxExxY protein
MEKAKLLFSREQEMPIFYEGIEVGSRRADFVVENTVLVELKAIIQLEDKTDAFSSGAQLFTSIQN